MKPNKTQFCLVMNKAIKGVLDSVARERSFLEQKDISTTDVIMDALRDKYPERIGMAEAIASFKPIERCRLFPYNGNNGTDKPPVCDDGETV